MLLNFEVFRASVEFNFGFKVSCITRLIDFSFEVTICDRNC